MTNFSKNSFYLLPEPLRLGEFLTNYWIGEHTHKRPWVNYEIRNAARQGKVIIGIYEHGCKDDVELPEAFKRYGTTTLGWNSVDKLIDVIEGRIVVSENPNGSASGPIQNIIRIKCN